MADEMIALTEADLAELRAISLETFSDTFGPFNSDEDMKTYLDNAYSLKTLQAEMDNPNSQFYFLKHDNNIVGYLKLNVGDAQSEEQGGDALEVERIYVRPGFKRRGYGGQMMKFALSRGYQLGKQFVWLGVWERNHAAQKFYEQFGFEMFDDHLFMLGNSRQRDVLMKKQLG
ncbi:GNAT family N-acetyltransferase [Secundilactobacillus folii]|uniref:GNAT family N-acetyltransferase n=1 Tax=Secundilactobacillus folii TaxID=2678357 RepID=A0A7X3C3C9_9LACO|nr:GNAT family N-acetyltransferase [Secundilactobacillus folii]MTV82752.1 GNAT family N-acetyltransferase [Secundilactobacillus folii]